MAERTDEVVKTRGVKRKSSESEDSGGSSKTAKTEPKPQQIEKKSINPKEILAKYYHTKVQETDKKLINPTEDDLFKFFFSTPKNTDKTEPKPQQAEKKPINPKEILAKYYHTKVQETVKELINPTEDDFDAQATYKRLEYYIFMARMKAIKAGIPCCVEFKMNL